MLLSYSRDFAVAPERAYALVLPMPLAAIFERGHGPIPPIGSTRQDGVWGTLGQQRVIDLVGPGSMTETLTVVEEPHRFGYAISDLKGPFALIVGGVEGEWRFDPGGPGGTGVRITWSWRVEPKGVLGRAGLPVFARLWQGYAAKAFESLGRELAQAA